MSYTLALNEAAPDFTLASTEGKVYRLADFSSHPFLVIFFTSNHCPYVLNSDEHTRKTVNNFKQKGVGFVAINSNSPNTYPTDSFFHMLMRMETAEYPWVYLFDPTQQIALDYGALKTPHFFVFNQQRRLVYTGRGVDSPRDLSKMKVDDLSRTLSELTEGKEVSVPMTNPIGCNIKWEGKDAHWMPAEACDLV